jgi:hypothetical protein
MKLNNEMRSASTAYGITLATQEDLVAVQKESIAEFGNAAILSGEVAANIAQTGKAFGYGATEAGKVNTQFMLMGMSGEDAAKAQENLAASALKAGVNVGAVMKDISTNAKGVAKYFGGNVEKLKAAAIEAQKLGMDLATMGKIAGGLLDIETSLSSQFEYQALTGKEINLDTARQLALTNDFAGAAKEVENFINNYWIHKSGAKKVLMEAFQFRKILLTEHQVKKLQTTITKKIKSSDIWAINK